MTHPGPNPIPEKPRLHAALKALSLPKRKPVETDAPRLRSFAGRKKKPLPGQLALEDET
jgi:hypothetical protein